MIHVRQTTPEEAKAAEPRDVRCDRCGVGREGDLRQLVFRGKTRYAERTVCDICAEELLELFIDAPSGAQLAVPIVRVLRARAKPGKRDGFWEWIRSEAVPSLVSAPGLLAYFPGEPLSESGEFVLVTIWRDFEAMLAWAGEDWEDPSFDGAHSDLLEEATVMHYSFFDAPPELIGRAEAQ